jgi:NAD(P)-dependent dehydrogenase (short-subunit alcohol dehydrogenase family)
MRLGGRTSIITGGAQGIGAAIARRFAAEGARVVIADLIEDKGRATSDAIASAGGQSIFFRCDASEPADIEALVVAALDAYGDIDTCVCCAGVARVVDFLEIDKTEFDRVVAINLGGPFLLGQRVARHMVARQHGGSIVNVSSVSAALANPGQEAYCASKAGLGGLTRAMAVSLASYGIRVNALAPGPTLTDMAADNPQYIKPMLTRTPLGRFARPDEMAAAALFLASDEASFMTGTTLFVDGGRLALNYTMPQQQTASQ